MLSGAEASTEELVRLRAQVQGLKLPTSLSALLAGNTHSIIVGRGMDYEESRKYASGDDSRMIDWRVTARTGTAHTKIFREDRQRLVHLIVDMTSSMRFGTRTAFKSVVAAEVAALIAWAAFGQGNRVSMTGISDSGCRKNRPASSTRTLIRQLDMLSNLSRMTSDASDLDGLGEALSAVVKRVSPGDMIVAISDFTNLSSTAVKAFEHLSSRRLLSAFWILDSVERTALPPGRYPVTDTNSHSTLHLSSRNRCENLQTALDRRNGKFNEVVTRLGTPMIPLQPGDDIVKILYRAFYRYSRLNSRIYRRTISIPRSRVIRD